MHAVTQQVFFHVGRFKRDEAVVTSRRATAKQKGELGDAFSEMDRTQKRVAAPIDVTANESKQIVDAIVWAAEEGKAQSSLVRRAERTFAA